MFLVGSVVLLTVVGYFSSRPDYVPLIGGLGSRDMANITSLLNDRQIPMKYEASRGMISVPSGQLEQAKLVLAEAGISGEESRADFDSLFGSGENSFGRTRFELNVNYTRALQARLEKQIEAMQPVDRAHVTISAPKEELFVRDRQDPKASVEIKLRRGNDVNRSIVDAIRQIVSSAVPKLKASNVAVVDNKGRVLARSKNDPDDFSTSAGDNLEMRRRYENHLTRKVEDMLDQALGSGRAVVEVAAELDFDWKETVSRRFDPTKSGGVVANETKNSKTSKGGSSGSGGVPGLSSNTPNGGGGARPGGGRTQETKDVMTQTNLKIDEETKTVREAIGAIKLLNVAVMIKPSYDAKEEKFVPLPE